MSSVNAPPNWIRIEYDRGDLRATKKEHRKYKSAEHRTRQRQWLTLVFLLSLIALLRYYISGGDPVPATMLVEALSVASVLLLSNTRNVTWHGIWEYGASEGYFYSKRNTVETKMPWAYLRGYSSTEHHLFIWTPGDSVFIIPRRAFESPQDFERVTELVRAKLKALNS